MTGTFGGRHGRAVTGNVASGQECPRHGGGDGECGGGREGPLRRGLFGLGDDAGGDDAGGCEEFGGKGLDFVFFDGLEIGDEGAGPV